jgi:biopolymer transport protein ExbD
VIHEVSIDSDGTVFWDGQALAAAAALDARKHAVSAHIKPDRLVDYGTMAAVLASVQRNGVRKMGMVGNGRFAA